MVSWSLNLQQWYSVRTCWLARGFVVCPISSQHLLILRATTPLVLVSSAYRSPYPPEPFFPVVPRTSHIFVLTLISRCQLASHILHLSLKFSVFLLRMILPALFTARTLMDLHPCFFPSPLTEATLCGPSICVVNKNQVALGYETW